MVGVSIAWVPVVTQTQGGQVFIYIQEVTNYLAPQVACVFLLGLLWTGCNEQVCPLLLLSYNLFLIPQFTIFPKAVFYVMGYWANTFLWSNGL